MIITDYAVKRRTTVFVLMALLLVSGVYAYLVLPREAAPDIEIPVVLVMTGNRGVSPEDMENTVTRELEQALESLDDLKQMSSISAQGFSTVILEFEPEIDMDDAIRRVKDEVESARPGLPSEADDPSVMEINASDFPIMVVTVHGKANDDRRYNLQILKQVAEELKDNIEMVPGVLEVRRAGGLTPEVRIEVDPDQLAAYRIPAELLVARYTTQDVNISGGSVDFGSRTYDIRLPMEFERDVEAARNIVITQEGEHATYLGDLAEIVPGFQDEDTLSRFNGEDAVSLIIQKKSGENILHTAAGVKYVLERARQSGRIPTGVELDLTLDQSEFIEMIVVDLDNNIATGFFLVVGVVLFALGFRNAFFVGGAIPMTFLVTLTALMVMNVTLNFIVLFSLILALGLMVDNAIVIVENIFRHQQVGHGRVEAAILGTQEVAWPIITSTITTLCAFAPLLFWPGVVGEFFGFLPLTIIVALTASLFVALVMNPAACASLMNVPKGQRWGAEGRELNAFMRGYRRLLVASIRHKALVAAVAFLVLFGMTALYFLTAPGIEFMPRTDPQSCTIDITMPEGTRVEKTDRFARRVEEGVRRVDEHGDVEHVVTSVGSRGTSSLVSVGGAMPDFARVSVEFKDIEDRTVPSPELIERFRDAFADVAGAEIRVQKQEMGPPSGAPVNIEIHGRDYDLLGRLAARVRRIVRAVPGVVDLKDDYEPGRPELRVAVDRKRAALIGLDPLTVGMTVQTAYMGRKVGVVRAGEEEYDVRVIAKEEERQGFGMLDKLYITTPNGVVPASAVTDWEIRGGKGSVRHIDRDRVVTVSGDVAKGYRGPEVRKEIETALADFRATLPEGNKIELTGEQEMQKEAQDFLFVAFVVSIFLIAMVLITQFNSLRLPLIILSSVLLSLVGVFFGLWVTRQPFSVTMTGVGVISLAGVVVNNAIVLIDYIQKLRERGLCGFDAVVEAGLTRLRPVLLTAITTICGLLPMWIGVNIDFHHGAIALGKEMSQFWRPMSTAVIFGLSVATVLTLVVAPTLYALLLRVREPEDPDREVPAPGSCEAPHTP